MPGCNPTKSQGRADDQPGKRSRSISRKFLASKLLVGGKIVSPRCRRGTREWEISTDNLSKAGWNWGCVATMDCRERTTFVADAHRDDGKRFVARADEKLTPFAELESAVGCAIATTTG
jgi:hypothetical protein